MIIDARGALQTALDDIETTILLLRPDAGDIMTQVHDEAVAAVRPQPWRKTYLLKRLTILTPAERDHWFDDGIDYRVLGGDTPKVAGPSGPKEDLLLADGTPSRMKIRSKFAEGDQL